MSVADAVALLESKLDAYITELAVAIAERDDLQAMYDDARERADRAEMALIRAEDTLAEIGRLTN